MWNQKVNLIVKNANIITRHQVIIIIKKLSRQLISSLNVMRFYITLVLWPMIHTMGLSLLSLKLHSI